MAPHDARPGARRSGGRPAEGPPPVRSGPAPLAVVPDRQSANWPPTPLAQRCFHAIVGGARKDFGAAPARRRWSGLVRDCRQGRRSPGGVRTPPGPVRRPRGLWRRSPRPAESSAAGRPTHQGKRSGHEDGQSARTGAQAHDGSTRMCSPSAGATWPDLRSGIGFRHPGYLPLTGRMHRTTLGATRARNVPAVCARSTWRVGRAEGVAGHMGERGGTVYGGPAAGFHLPGHAFDRREPPAGFEESA